MMLTSLPATISQASVNECQGFISRILANGPTIKDHNIHNGGRQQPHPALICFGEQISGKLCEAIFFHGSQLMRRNAPERLSACLNGLTDHFITGK